MPLQIFKYHPHVESFVPLQQLDFFCEFGIFKAFKAFGDLQGVLSFKDLQSVRESRGFKELKEFKSFKEFEGFLSHLHALSYYKDFSLLLCSSCNIAVSPANLKGHLAKHFLDLKGKAKEGAVLRAIGILQELEVSSLSLSLDLISSFSITHTLPPFQELNTLEGLFMCSFCPHVGLNKQSMQRHLRGQHIGLGVLDLPNSYTAVAQGQGLEPTRFFFQVETRDKGKGAQGGRRARSRGEAAAEEEGLHSPHSPSLNLEEEDPFAQASRLFLKEFDSKKEALFSNSVCYSLSKEEPLSPLQKKTKYLQFLNNRNPKSLALLSSPCKEDEEPLLNILVINLKELLYLSLDRSRYVNSIPLQHLNSFQRGVVRNKPFRPLLRSNSRLKYFGFFSCFLAFVYRSFCSNKYKEDKLYSLSRESKGLLRELKQLALLQQEEAARANLDLNKGFQQTKRALNKRLNSFTLNLFLRGEDALGDKGELGGEDDGEGELSSDSNNSLHSSLYSSSPSTSSSSSEEGVGGPAEEDASSTASASSTKSLSNTLLEKIEQLGKLDNPTSAKIQEKLLCLFLHLFKQEPALYIFDSPINSFFACKSVNPSNGTLRGSLDLSRYYSFFLYCAQLLVLENSMQVAIKDHNPKAVLYEVQDFMCSHFNNTSLSPLSEILNNRSYCFEINKGLSSLSNIIIHPHLEDTLTYGKVTISKDELSRVFQAAILEANALVDKELLFNIPLEGLRDFTLESFSPFEDLLDDTPYKCFKDYHPDAELHNKFLINKVLSVPALKKRFFTLKRGKLSLNRRQVKLYLRDSKEFLRHCLMLVHFTSGLPLRGTELSTFRFLNSFKDKRECVLDRASALFIINISTRNKGVKDPVQGSNIRYLPKSVSMIFLKYIALVVPFLEFLLISSPSLPFKVSLSPYFFVINQQVLTSKDLSTGISTFTNKVLGKKLNIQVYRQIILGVIKFFMQEKLEEVSLSLLEEEGQDGGVGAVIANQMNHSLAVEELHYARPITTFPNVKTSVQLRYLKFCLRFFNYFTISDLPLSSHPFTGALQEENSLESNNRESLANNFALCYTRSSAPLPSLAPPLSSSRKHTRGVSSIASALQREQGAKRVKLQDLQAISSSTSSSVVLLDLLRDFLSDEDASFTCLEQELLVKGILLSVPYILGVLATNKGKSLCYLLTASLVTSKITIVVLPLVGLKEDMLRRTRDFKIPTSIYEKSSAFATLTLVSVETIVSNTAFLSSLTRLIQEGKVDRVVVDECHLLITSRSYRSIMFQVRKIFELKVQFVFLSGTLPFYLEKALREEFLLNSLCTIRGSTTRANIVYSSKQYASSRAQEQLVEVKEYIESYFAKFSSLEDKVLVFCPTVAKVKGLSEFLSCPAYYSALGEAEKGEVLRSYFTSSKEKILVSSSSLEEGIDHPSIRLVVYIDFVHSFIGFLQGSSRGGRDNKESTSMFFHLKGEEVDREGDDSNADKCFIRRYLREQVCKRRVIEEYLDSNIVEQCSSSVSKCDLCSLRSSIQEGTISSLLGSNKEVQIQRDAARVFFERLQLYCLPCLLLGERGGDAPLEEHEFVECPCYYKSLSKELSKVREGRGYIQEKHLKQDSCCFFCFLPTYLCSALKKEGARCCNSNTMALFFAICIVYYKELCLEDVLSVSSFAHWNFYSLAKVFFNKVFLKDLDTHATQGVAILRDLCWSLA